MRINVKGAALAAATVWGACFFVTGIANLLWPPYGAAWMDLGASIYPGYHGPGGFGSVIAVTLYALLDGAIFGAVFAWLYNAFAGGGRAHAAADV
jgi:hypothetical protein